MAHDHILTNYFFKLYVYTGLEIQGEHILSPGKYLHSIKFWWPLIALN